MTIRGFLAAGLLLGLLLSAVPARSHIASVGQLYAGSLEVSGYNIPLGTTLLDGAEVETQDRPAVLLLNQGPMVVVWQNAVAEFHLASLGDLRIAVLEGRVSARASDGRMETAFAGGSLRVSDDRLTASAGGSGTMLVREELEKGSNRLALPDTRGLSPNYPIILETLDGSRYIYCVKKVVEGAIVIRPKAQISFPQGSWVIHGDDFHGASEGAEAACNMERFASLDEFGGTPNTLGSVLQTDPVAVPSPAVLPPGTQTTP